jgi:hypothetical protein
MIPSNVLLMMESSDESTMAASNARASSVTLREVMS